ncbi:hypothetical protein O6H91_06G060600 [Diphasiastrum complanatum]|uniref:Uncharacterized protein n=7 Tax=Diphasiastrum complanatum TaxID=34168 RepID=A0ACC2DEN0_DIPCM|nr:hypothetical protein O6H91_06G060600 [Diphasiastrum complanatum]KAJ7552572.1 hypothetical protein O6H91_06G060600 [Diphasiastrum complanatum]KAJ7552575.1 hypothetical protein O6H91_06G060600 [Diphasiastrum complanatum]KAJ7552576.1 hypothetical protein O6H91_06G060600 [Diphasiastrum complanatum]KAJ7552577.1 hypothetical protein O6H91_06G060600 [Diphasiastrum complanatum]
MGGGQSKEEQLYHAVQAGNHTTVKALRRDGTSLEWVDKEGRTPLILACTRGESFDMVITLINLGANISVYRPGTHGGTPVHHAAKRGLDKTVVLLLGRGADPLQSNDDGLTPLDMARSRGHISVVRIIEDRLCLFSGIVRELSGPGFLEALMPQWVTRKVWVVVLPARPHPKRHPKHELVIYQSPKVSQPRAIITLARARIREPDYTAVNPMLVIVDRSNRQTYKFLSEHENDNIQLERLFEACSLSSQGVPSPVGSENSVRPALLQRSDLPALQSPNQPSGQHFMNVSEEHQQKQSRSRDVALNMAIDASIQSGSTEGIIVPYLGPQTSGISERGAERHKKGCKDRDCIEPKKLKYGEALDYFEAGPSKFGKQSEVSQEAFSLRVAHAESSENRLSSAGKVCAMSTSCPTAPPLPSEFVSYPASKSRTLYATSSKSTNAANAALALEVNSKIAGQCVVCWDAPVQGVCIPCGHLAGCMNCLLDIKERSWGCPVCRTQIQQVVKVYTV